MIPTLLLLALFASDAAPDRSRLLAEIDRDVWAPFVAAVNADHPEGYVAVHSSEFRWVAPGEKGRIMSLDEYDEDSRTVMRERKKKGETTTIEVRFLERNIREDFAVEKAITRWTLRRQDGTAETGYGIAHYFLRKEKGVWKIWLRYGSREKGDAAAFEAAGGRDQGGLLDSPVPSGLGS